MPRLLRIAFVLAPAELREWTRTFRALKGRDMLIMTGTGMLTDHEEGPLGLPYEIFKWTLAARIRRVRVFFVSVGVEPINRRLTRMFIRTSLRLAAFISYRDDQSKRRMAAIGFDRKSEVFPDLAFSLPQTLLPADRGRRAGKLVVGIGVFDYCGRGTAGPDAGDRYRDYLDKIGSFTSWLVERGHPVRVLIGDLQYDTPVRDDLRRLLESRGLAYEERGIVDEPVSTIADLFGQIGKTDIVVASRFHNVLIALMLGKPVISLSYNEKNDALMAETGLGGYCQAIADFRLDWLIERLGTVERDAAALADRIKVKADGYRRALEEQFRVIFGIGEGRAG